MNLLKRLASLFSGGAPSADKRYLTIYVLSRRCNEPISGQVDLLNELSKTDDGEYAYYTRKVLHTTGESRCFSQVEIEIFFNQDKKVVDHEVTGGSWLTGDEFEAEMARFNAPLPEEDPEHEELAAATDSVAGSDLPATSPSTGTPTKTSTDTPTAEENNNA